MSEVLRAGFEIERVKGDFVFPAMQVTTTYRTVYNPDGTEKQIPQRKYDTVQRKATEAFMVYFPQGHSLCFDVKDTAMLERYGLAKDAEAADFGELLPGDDAANLPRSPKQIVAARMNKGMARIRVNGGLSTVDQM